MGLPWEQVFAGSNPAAQINYFCMYYFIKIYFQIMKTCTRCKEKLEFSNFSIINNKTGKMASMCKPCLREYNREYWSKVKHLKNPQKNARSRRKRIEIRKFIIAVLQSNICADCGISDWRVLEFDHRDRKLKKFNLADSTQHSLKKVKAEIAKCDIVCANCHNIRTIEQRNYYSGLI